jgi:hypothetical protein
MPHATVTGQARFTAAVIAIRIAPGTLPDPKD